MPAPFAGEKTVPAGGFRAGAKTVPAGGFRAADGAAGGNAGGAAGGAACGHALSGACGGCLWSSNFRSKSLSCLGGGIACMGCAFAPTEWRNDNGWVRPSGAGAERTFEMSVGAAPTGAVSEPGRDIGAPTGARNEPGAESGVRETVRPAGERDLVLADRGA